MASLQELPDDELDKLFRSSAEEFEPPYNPDDWNNLRRRLDDGDRSRVLDRLIYWGLPLLLLVLSLISMLTPATETDSVVQTVAKRPEQQSVRATGSTTARLEESPTVLFNTQSGRSVAERSTETSASTRSAPKQAEQNHTQTVSETKSTEKTVTVQPETAREVSHPPAQSDNSFNSDRAVSSTNTRTTSPKNRLAKMKQAGNGSTNETALGRFDKSIPTRNRRNLARNTAFPGKAYTDEKPTERLHAGSTVPPLGADGPSSSNDRPNADPTSTATGPFDLAGNLANIRIRVPQSPALPALPEPALWPVATVSKPVPPAVPVIGYPALSIRGVAAPNRNFVGNSRQGANDFSMGILAEYRFSRRFTIQSGVIRSVKKYTAPASEYTMPDSIANHWYGPYYESVGAVCTILDIPVNLRYDVLLNNRRRWFINAGVSSYIMQKETYAYNYPPGSKPSTQQKYKGWSGKTGLHQFSHLNFSVGYERNFRSEGFLRRVSWQVEPFLKKPLSDLGYGKIRLRSAGVFFSLRYRL